MFHTEQLEEEDKYLESLTAKILGMAKNDPISKQQSPLVQGRQGQRKGKPEQQRKGPQGDWQQGKILNSKMINNNSSSRRAVTNSSSRKEKMRGGKGLAKEIRKNQEKAQEKTKTKRSG